MTDFKLSFLGQRKRSGERGAEAHLERMAEEIGALDEAAARASRRIAESAAELRGASASRDGDADLLGELAGAVAGRSQAIREECARLSSLLERARGLVDQRATPPAPAADWEVTAAALDGVAEPSPRRGAQPLSELREEATRMAISGCSRSEISQRLGAELAPGEIAPLLDEIFGQAPAGANR